MENEHFRIKVLHIIKSLGRGGAETLLTETISLTNPSDFETHVIYFLPWKNQMVDALQKAGATVTCFSATNNLLILLQAFKIKRYCRQHKIDVVHCHLPWAGFVGRFLSKLSRLPVIYTEHNLQERYHWFTRLLNKVSFNCQSAVIAVSDDVHQSINRIIKPKIQVTTIPNGVNTEKFTRDVSKGEKIRTEYSIPNTALVIGTIAVFRFQKRLSEWISLANELHDKHPELYFIVVGAGPLEQELKIQAAKTSLGDKLIMPGLQTDVIPWLSAMDVYLMTSKFEGLPIALLEAMSMECAIATTDAGGIKEVIRDKTDGLMCSVDELERLRSFIEFFANNPQTIKPYGQAARNRIQQSFSLQKMLESVEAVYLRTIQSSKL